LPAFRSARQLAGRDFHEYGLLRMLTRLGVLNRDDAMRGRADNDGAVAAEVLAVAERAPATFSGVVGGLPRRVVQERAEPREVVSIQVRLLLAERRQRSSRGISLPSVIALLGFGRSTPLPLVVLPDAKPCLQKSSGYTKCVADGTSQRIGQRLAFFGGQALGLV